MTTMVNLEESVAQLAGIVGSEHVRMAGGVVHISPAETQQIAEVLRYANENQLAVMPMGGGTKLRWGNPVEAAIHLSLTRMNAVREHAWQDMTCTVQAGCTWAAMQSALAQHGQMVALDPVWQQRATAGGIVATNDTGALRLKYGGLRDLIIGMTIVLADGTIAKTGGKVVKNVAGYDLHKLMTGSFGTLGVIAEINFRLHPKERTCRTWEMHSEQSEVLHGILLRLLDSQLALDAVQLHGAGQSYRLHLRSSSCIAETVVETENALRSLAAGLELRPAEEDTWQAREKLFSHHEAVVIKTTMLPTQITAALTMLQNWASRASQQCHSVTQANGIMTAALSGSHFSIVLLIEKLRAHLKPTGGAVTIVQLPVIFNPHLDVPLNLWGSTSDALPLMREIKRRFDPNRILNPGRFVGGI